LINPAPGAVEDFKKKQLELEQRLQQVRAVAGQPAKTANGRRVEVAANIGDLASARDAVENGAEGVGLLRTEFLYLDETQPPSEEKQYNTYREIFEVMGQRPVIVRTLDIGGDKPPSYLSFPNEMNPFLGWRAILRAAEGYQARIMFPMISGIVELRAAKRALYEARDELVKEGHEVEVPSIGIMIELPSAALVSDRLARECDFFSIGTNDLIQYAIGIDRQNKDVAYLYRPLHLAVLRMVKGVCDAGRDAGIPVSMCGEMAGDPVNALVLIGLGVTELSMNGPSIPFVKRVIRAARASDAQALVDRLLALTAADEIEREVRTEMVRRFPWLVSEEPLVGPGGT